MKNFKKKYLEFKKPYWILLIFCIGSFFSIKAQQAAYFLFGESQFKGLHVYDVIQDKELNYYFATNDGLFLYDYIKFEKIEIKEARSISIFNFVKNKQGDIFFNNLNNQIFILRANKVKLFYELPDEQNTAVITLKISDDDNIIIGSKFIYVIDKQSKLIHHYLKAAEYSTSFKFVDNSVYFHKRATDTVVVYAKGRFTERKMKIRNSEKLYLLDFFLVNDSIYALDISHKKIYYYDHINSELNSLDRNDELEQFKGIRAYVLNGRVWVAGALRGIAKLNLYRMQNDLPFYYKDFFISDMFKDAEGNILLSTFGKGIMVIPNMEIPDVINSFKDDPVSILYKDTVGLLIGTNKGNLLLSHNNKTEVICSKGSRSIDVLKGSSISSLVFFDDGEIKAYNKSTGKILKVYNASLKDVAFVNETEFYLGTNVGIFKGVWDGKNGFHISLIDELQFRIYALVYQNETKSLYISSMNGLFRLINNKEVQKITNQNQNIFPNSLVNMEDKVLASTHNLGIMIIKNNAIVGTFEPMINKKLEPLTHFIGYKNTIIGRSSSGGIFQFDFDGRLIRKIHVDFGFTSKKVFNFTSHNQELWVSHDGGVQRIDLEYKLPQINKPSVRIQQLLVNDSVINHYTTTVFNYDQRKLEFIITCPTIKHQQNIIYQHRLIGYNEVWQSNSYLDNRLSFNALAPGKYTLQVKADIQGIESEIVIYDFVIERPFYLNNWFILSVLCLFLGGVYFVYRFQINSQNAKSKRLNELNASKLTAIKSQMNPHFIFNSLNSIQDLILKGDVENSYSYIITFSDLVRRTLNYSEKEFIEFEEEIQLLELYLSLEKLRFKKDFTYTINSQIKDDFLIPPMLIQPFVENALIHGLLHKEGPKNLVISFQYDINLVCIIEDNGIGRKKSQEIKIRQKTHYESFSNNAIRKRFEILSEIFKGQYDYTYQDLKQGDIAIGTIVSLRIPVKTKY
ncbi:MAG: histidine kinase [Bacteroidota bacterium]|nr:histidine kinase [Bacteroidota bacterium]